MGDSLTKTKNKELATVEGILRKMSDEDEDNWLNQVYIQHSLSKIYTAQGRNIDNILAQYASMYSAMSYIVDVFKATKGQPSKTNYIYIKAAAQIGILHSKDLGESDKTAHFSKTIAHSAKMADSIDEDAASGMSIG
ncbi:MAG: hypothetical protein KGH60_03755 [Candidatus Micrarchaeota archaeon]|nr:hypothetical protein [Candidatus Micrarchaeota archaeon]